MRRFYLYDDNNSFEAGEEEYIEKNKDAKMIWVDIEEPDEDDIKFLKEQFNFHDLALEHCRYKSTNIKFDDYGDYKFLLLASLNKISAADKTIYKPIYIFISERYIVTLQYYKNSINSKLISEIKENPQMFNKGTYFILYMIFKEIMDRYFIVNDRLEAEIDFLQDEVMDNPDKEMLSKIIDLKRKMIRFRKNAYRNREILSIILKDKSSIFKEENEMFFSDLYQHALILYEVIEGNKEMISVTLELYSSQLSNKTNDVMKFLTIITTIMMPITVITGIYGMNFVNMPEMNFKYSYLIFWILIILSVIIQLRYFKKKKWI